MTENGTAPAGAPDDGRTFADLSTARFAVWRGANDLMARRAGSTRAGTAGATTGSLAFPRAIL